MKGVARLLELWEDLSAPSRELLTKVAEALAEKPFTRPTIVVRNAHVITKTKHCPDCQDVITNKTDKYCGRCGCMLPVWVWPEG